MTGSTLRFWFCIAVAAIAAAIADPLVETASNHGLFGAGNYTDHSNLNVVPTLLAGLLFVALQLFLRTRSQLACQPVPDWLGASRFALSAERVPALMPACFVLQLAVLYLMETAEQLIVAGHPLGGTIWLGGPIVVSLAVHAVLCALTALAIAGGARAFTRAAVQIIRLIRAIATRCARGPLRTAHQTYRRLARECAPLPCRIGERAPPFSIA